MNFVVVAGAVVAVPRSNGEPVGIDGAPPLEQRLLMQEISAALRSGANGADLADLVIRTGWQTRTVSDPNAVILQGVLASGRRVPIEIRRSTRRRPAENALGL